MTSIKDVARLAGVSLMTASRVVNQKGTVSPRNRALVLQAVKDLNYRPNLAARGLRAKRTGLLGFLVPDIENPVFASLCKHVEEEAQRFGYNVLLGNCWEDPEREAKYLDIMIARQMDGLVISPVSSVNAELIEECPVPLVVLDRTFGAGGRHPAVTVDNLEVGRLAARHLLSLGHRRFACVHGPLDIAVFAERLEGFGEELAAAGFAVGLLAGVAAAGTPANGARAGEEILAGLGDEPAAVFCANDITAMGVLQAAHRRGVDVPGRLSVVGVDDIRLGEMTTPTLTTVRQPFAEIAASGVRLLVDMLRDRARRPDSLTLGPELVARESTGPARTPPAGRRKRPPGKAAAKKE